MTRCAITWLLVLSVISVAGVTGCSNTSQSQTIAPRHKKVTASKKPIVAKQSVVPDYSLEQAGINDPASVRMVIYQRSGYKKNPELIVAMCDTVLAPFKFSSVIITNRARIAAFYNAIDRAEQTKEDRIPRHDRLAFVTRDNRVVVFGVSKAEAGQPVFITPTRSSTVLSELLLKAYESNPRPSRLVDLQISEITYSNGKDKKSLQESRSDKWRAAIEASRELMGRFDPMTLKGNKHYNEDDIVAFYYSIYNIDSAPYLEMKLKRPASVSAVILPDNLNWPASPDDTSSKQESADFNVTVVDDKGKLATIPDSQLAVKDYGWPPVTYDANGKLETIRFDIIRVYDEWDGVVRIGLLDSGGRKGVFSDPLSGDDKLSISRIANCLDAE